MKRFLYTFVAAVMCSVMAWAKIGAPASIDFGTYNIHDLEEVSDSIELVLEPEGISDWGIGVEVLNDKEGIFTPSDTWLYDNGTPDYYGVEKAKIYFYAIEVGSYTATLRLTDYKTDEFEDVALSVTVVDQDEPSDVENIDITTKAKKILRNGQLIINRNGEEYGVMGERL